MTKRLACLTLAVFTCASGPAYAQGQRGGSFDVKVVTDIAYHTGSDADSIRHKLDLYLPAGRTEFPVLFFVHGGGWTKGSKEKFEHLGRVLAKNGVGVICPNYRLTPQVTHPGHIQDVARAFAWTEQNIGKYGGCSDHIFVSGHSAGGQLAALLGTDDAYLKAHGLSVESIKGVIPISGVYQLTERQEASFGDAKSRQQASPLSHVNGKRPPFLFLYAEKDIPNCDKLSAAMTAALKKAGNEASWTVLSDRDHGSIVGRMGNEDDPATQAVLAFIARHSGLRLSPAK